MIDHYHAIVWMDHQEAKIFYVTAEAAEQMKVDTHNSGHHLQHKAHVRGSGHQGIDRDYFKRVCEALSHSEAIMLTGPGHAKLEFKNYLAETHSAVAGKISAIESLDHLHDAQLVALARKFFKADDRMHGVHT